jgi:hypothetical protein
MLLRTSIIAAFVSLAFAAPAVASCWSNKAICRAICGADCCDGWGSVAIADRAALSLFSAEDLQAEVGRIRKNERNKSFLDAVNAEIKTRRSRAPSTTRGVTISE